VSVVEKSDRAWYVYNRLRELDYDNSLYTDQQLEHLYDAAQSVAVVTCNTIHRSLGYIMNIVTRMKSE
jgi:hypothetical protein